MQRQCVIELNADGTDYLTHGNFQEEEFTQHWTQVRMVLEDASCKCTRQQLLADWPADFPRPDDTTLWRWLQRAVTLGLVLQDGSGRKNDPFLYWLPDKEKLWRADPLYELRRKCQENDRKARAELERLGLWPNE